MEVSAVTISRVERSNAPEINTFCKMCLWFEQEN